jgi:L-ascorbate metabolism protein UlaG (beta-lactamase superfamily)
VTTNLTPEPTPISEALRTRLGPFVASPTRGSGYANPWEHPALPGLGDVLRWKTQANPVRPSGYKPAPLSLPKEPLASFQELSPAATRLFWIGHASFLLDLDGVRLVIDPIFGRAGGVVPRVTQAAARPEELTDVQAVLVTHGHHDHLDPGSLKLLAQANRDRIVFVVPRGLGATLPGICRPVVELDWWEHVTLNGVRIHLVPAQHWHRRGMFDHNKGLWGGFVIEGSHRVYHSGDTGYFGGFRAIGEVFGGIDAACLPLGAYEPAWFMASQHMSPDQSLTAYQDLAATHFVGMHWGAFDLSDEPVDAGAHWLKQAVRKEALPEERFHVLAPGGSVALHGARGQTRALQRHPWLP